MFLLAVPVKKGKAIPLHARTGPQGSRRLRLPDFKTAHEGGKVVNPRVIVQLEGLCQ